MTKSMENDALALLRSCARHEWMDSAIERMWAYKPDWRKGKKTVFEGPILGRTMGWQRGLMKHRSDTPTKRNVSCRRDVTRSEFESPFDADEDAGPTSGYMQSNISMDGAVG